MPRFIITLERTRTITETVELKVTTKDADTAEEKALDKADAVQEKDWEVQDEEIAEVTVVECVEE